MIAPTKVRAPTKEPSPSRETFAAPPWFPFDKLPDDVPPEPPPDEPPLPEVPPEVPLSGSVNGPLALLPFPVIDPMCFPPVSSNNKK